MSTPSISTFPEALAALVTPFVQEVAPAMPVLAGMESPHEDGTHVFLSEPSFEEVVPGTFFYIIRGRVELRQAAAGLSADDMRELRCAVMEAILEGLQASALANMVELDEFGCPATLRGLYPELAPMEVEGSLFVSAVEYRAYVQF